MSAVAFIAWRGRGSDEERAIRAQLEALRAEVNRTETEGTDALARAAALGSYFTEDVIVDLGDGTAPIEGRLTLIGMAGRLQPRTAAFRLDFDDVGVELTAGAPEADVTLTASFVRRALSTGDEARDAREFALALTRTDGTWRIARVTAVDILRKF